MSKVHVIAMDTHSQTTDICVKTEAAGACRRWCVKTRIPEIVEVLKAIKGPRELVFEEGPLAGWLLRNLRGHVEKAMVCDPRKNALVSGGGGGDKDDAIDAAKLCDLYLMNYVQPVHHAESLGREVAKQTVGLYHERVAHRVRSANKAMGLLKRWGIMAREKDFQEEEQRANLLSGLTGSEAERLASGHVKLLWRSYDRGGSGGKADASGSGAAGEAGGSGGAVAGDTGDRVDTWDDGAGVSGHAVAVCQQAGVVEVPGDRAGAGKVGEGSGVGTCAAGV